MTPRTRIWVAATVVALVVAGGVFAVTTGDDDPDVQARGADGPDGVDGVDDAAAGFECSDVSRFFEEFKSLGITYDYEPSPSLEALTDGAERVVRGTLVGIRDVRAGEDGDVVIAIESIEGDVVEFSRSYNPAAIAFADLADSFTHGIPAVVFLRSSDRPWEHAVALEGFFVACAGDQPPLSIGVAPYWSPGNSLDGLVLSDDPAAVAPDCVPHDGPTALVAVDATNGEHRWTRLTGLYNELRLDDGVVSIDALDHMTEIDAATGDPVACSARHRPDQPVQASTTGPPPAEPPAVPPRIDGQTELWALHTSTAGAENQQVRRIVVVDRTIDEVAWEAVVPGFEVYLLHDLVVAIDQTGGTGTWDVNTGNFGPDTRVTAYTVASGEEAWQVALPGAPWLAVDGGVAIIVPVGTELVAIDPPTGGIQWRVDLGSPGMGGPYSENGGIREVLVDLENGLLIAEVVANEPYED